MDGVRPVMNGSISEVEIALVVFRQLSSTVAITMVLYEKDTWDIYLGMAMSVPIIRWPYNTPAITRISMYDWMWVGHRKFST